MKNLITKIIGVFINITAGIVPKWSAEVSFKLLCKVQRVGFSKKGKQFLATATTTFLEIDGHSSALHRWGNGPKKILFLHGWMSNSQRWLPYVTKLDLNEFSVYALDAPGHGMAKGNHLNIEIYRKAVIHAIEKTGPIETLICHSLGCLVAGYAYLHNSKLAVNRFVIMGTPSGMDAIFVYFRKLLGLSSKAIRNLDRKVNSILKIPHQEILMSNFFSNVDRPVLVIHDKTDKITPFVPIEKALEQHEKIRTLFTMGLKHDLKSDEVYATVTNYIKYRPQEIKQSYSA